jgi:hypothetical protein
MACRWLRAPRLLRQQGQEPRRPASHPGEASAWSSTALPDRGSRWARVSMPRGPTLVFAFPRYITVGESPLGPCTPWSVRSGHLLATDSLASRSGAALRGRHHVLLVRQQRACHLEAQPRARCVAFLVALHSTNQRAVEQGIEADERRGTRSARSLIPCSTDRGSASEGTSDDRRYPRREHWLRGSSA